MINKVKILRKWLLSNGFYSEAESLSMLKVASELSKKRARGLNWTMAELELAAEFPSQELSRDIIEDKISKNPFFSSEDLDKIYEIDIKKIRPKILKRLNKNEVAFIEVGSVAYGRHRRRG